MRAWHPPWPGFSSRGSLLLPLPTEAFEELPPSLGLHDIEFTLKREFHVTVLDRDTGRRLRTQETIGQVRPTARTLFEGEDWAWQPTGKKWLLREPREEGVAHSIIELLDLPGLVRFRHNIGWAHGQPLPSTPAHVTLYVSGDEAGIGLPSKEDFQRLRLRQL